MTDPSPDVFMELKDEWDAAVSLLETTRNDRDLAARYLADLTTMLWNSGRLHELNPYMGGEFEKAVQRWEQARRAWVSAYEIWAAIHARRFPE